MTQQSEERISDPTDIPQQKARVIPFERPQSELQKAVQQRAQEAIDRDRDRAKQRPAVWRRALVLALAAIPVVITFGAAIGFVGALRQFNSAVFNSATDPKTGSEQTQSQPPPGSQDPDVVMLQSYDKPAAPTTATPPPAKK